MERELKQNEKALDGVADEFDDAEKQADQFGDELKDAGDKADDAGRRFQKLGGVLKGIGAAMGTAFVAVGAAAVGAAKALTDMTWVRLLTLMKSSPCLRLRECRPKACRHTNMPPNWLTFLWRH